MMTVRGGDAVLALQEVEAGVTRRVVDKGDKSNACDRAFPALLVL